MSSQPYTEAWLTGPSSTQFYTRTYTPSSSTKAAVVFVHGFAEHVGRYGHFHPLLSARGIAVFAYDQRGFGLTGQDTTGKKSKSSAYGKTSWKEQMVDIDWAIGQAQKAFEGVPIFLMGHSMGGGEVLGFATQGQKGAHRTTLDSLSGIIATSPLILQTTPAPKLARFVGGKLGAIFPNTIIPAGVKADELSHDPEVNSAYLKDPLVKQAGSLKGISDMLSRGEVLLHTDYAHWPKSLPVLIVHGTEDKVTSDNASQVFHDKLSAEKKKLSLFSGGFHELQNEPDGVKEKLADEVIAFIEEHSSKQAIAEGAPAAESEEHSKGAEAPTEPVPEAEPSTTKSKM